MNNENHRKVIIEFFNNVKILAISNQCYELAAASRDAEKDAISSEFIDSNKFYEKAKYLVNTQKITPKMGETLHNYLSKLYSVLMRQEIRSNLISEILGEDKSSD